MPNLNLTCIFLPIQDEVPIFWYVKNFQTTSNDIQGRKVTFTLTPLLRVTLAGYGISQ